MSKRFFVSFLLLMCPLLASAGPIGFTFADDPSDWPWIGRSHVPGTVTGILYGLADNGTGQIPTAIEFTSDVSGLGMTSTYFDSFTAQLGTGFDLIAGSIVSANLLLNFTDPAVNGMQVRWNFDSRNVLHWNGGGGPISGMGNANGFQGATYGAVSQVPEPATLALIGLGLAGLSYRRRKQAL